MENVESTQKVGDLVMSWRTGDVPLTYLPGEKPGKKPGSNFHRPPPHRPLLAGADVTSEIFQCNKNFLNCLLPPGTKPIHAGKNSGGINFRSNTCGACIRTCANTGKYFWGIIIRRIARFLKEFNSVRIHVAPVFAPARIQENIPGELFMYWFRARAFLNLVAPSTGWMLYYLCFSPSTAIGPPLRRGVRLGGAISPYLASTHR